MMREHRSRWEGRALLGLAIAAAILACAAPAPAQTSRLPVIGLIGGGTREAEQDRVPSFKSRLAELGWRDGETMRLEERYAGGDAARIAALADELVTLKPDIIAAVGTTETRELKARTTTIPVVFLQIADPVASGLVPNVAHPGGNISGIAAMPQFLSAKRLELMIELLGKPRRLAFLANPRNAGMSKLWDSVVDAAAQAQVPVERIDAATPDELRAAFDQLAGFDCAFVMFDFFMHTHRWEIAETLARLRLPAMYENSATVLDGGLISFGTDYRENFRRGADYVDRILRGARVGDLPVDQASRFELVINQKAADALGLAIPSQLLARADEVIE